MFMYFLVDIFPLITTRFPMSKTGRLGCTFLFEFLVQILINAWKLINRFQKANYPTNPFKTLEPQDLKIGE